MSKRINIPRDQLENLVSKLWLEPEIAEFYNCSIGYIKKIHPGVLKMGRPVKIPKEEFVRQVRVMASYGSTEEDMKDSMEVSMTLFNKWKKLPDFMHALKKGRAIFRRSIRQGQLKSALSGNAATLIWLAKQYLGQTDSGLVVADDTGKTTEIDAERILRTCGSE